MILNLSIIYHLIKKESYLCTSNDRLNMTKNTMGTKLPRKLAQKMSIVGEQIKLARLRRNLSMAQIAERATCSPLTVSRIEKGVPTVAIGIYSDHLIRRGWKTDSDSIFQPSVTLHQKRKSIKTSAFRVFLKLWISVYQQYNYLSNMHALSFQKRNSCVTVGQKQRCQALCIRHNRPINKRRVSPHRTI